MLKVIGREATRTAFWLSRMIRVQYQRRKEYIANEPSEILVQNHNVQFRMLANDVDSYQDAQNVFFLKIMIKLQIYNFANIKKSKGNYVVDADHNIMLDLVGTEGNPLGYNHEAFYKVKYHEEQKLIQILNSKEFDPYIINSSLTSEEVAPSDYSSIIEKSIGQIAPQDLKAVTLTHFREGLEKALMTALAERENPNGQVLGFSGQYGGFPSFALQQFSGKNNTPSLNWPVIAYPKSQSEESQALDQTRSALQEARNSRGPVGAVTIQPVQCGTGYSVSQDFLSQLNRLAKENEAAFVVDEQATVLSTGRGIWAYEGEADYVVFGKKTQASGFFSRPESKSFSYTSGGDIQKLLSFHVIHDVVKKDSLIEKSGRVGKQLKESINQYVNKNNGITSVTGEGTHLYVNTQDQDTADKLWGHMISNGVITKRNGGRGISIKPSLLFASKHSDQFLQVLSRFKL